MDFQKNDILKRAREIIEIEKEAIESVINHLNDNFTKLVKEIYNCNGRVVVSGMGKAGLIGQKISATLSSTGTPSFFLHPAEGLHGDIGMVKNGDIVIFLSNSGETEEIIKIIPPLKKIGVKIASITSSKDSSLGKLSDFILEYGKIKEACPLGLAPSSSTTAMLVIGDAISLTLLEMRNFTLEDFALYHPGGNIGKRLLKVEDVIRRGKRCPLVKGDDTIFEVLDKITTAKAGMAIIIDENDKIVGVFTDGDFRRNWRENPNIGNEPVKKYMTKNCKTIKNGKLVDEATFLMRKHKINQLPVVDEENRVIGLLDIQDVT